MSLGALALDTLFTDETRAAAALVAKKPPLPCKAKHVIHIFAGGAPSQLDTFDAKPSLEKFRDQTAAGFRSVLSSVAATGRRGEIARSLSTSHRPDRRSLRA